MPATTQSDLVEQNMEVQPQVMIEKVVIPGIETLHTKSTQDIAETLTFVLKSRPNIVEFRYVIGKYIELTTDSSQ